MRRHLSGPHRTPDTTRPVRVAHADGTHILKMGERFPERALIAVLFLRGMQRHHPAGVIDVPGAVPAAGGDRAAEGILQSKAFKRGIDPSLRHGTGEIRGEDEAITRTHQRCSKNQSATHASQTSAIITSAVRKASATTAQNYIVQLHSFVDAASGWCRDTGTSAATAYTAP